MRAAAEDAGRDPGGVEVSVLSAAAGPGPVPPAVLDEYRSMAELGVRRVVLARERKSAP